MKPARDLDLEKDVVNLILEAQANIDISFVDAASQLGYANPNFLTNVKKMISRVPLAKAVDFAKVFKIDPHIFCKTCLDSYMPELKEFVAYASGDAQTVKEKKVINLMRSVDHRGAFGPQNKAQWVELEELMKTWK